MVAHRQDMLDRGVQVGFFLWGNFLEVRKYFQSFRFFNRPRFRIMHKINFYDVATIILSKFLF